MVATYFYKTLVQVANLNYKIYCTFRERRPRANKIVHNLRRDTKGKCFVDMSKTYRLTSTLHFHKSMQTKPSKIKDI